MTRTTRYLGWIALALIVPGAGSFIMFMLIFILPRMSDSVVTQTLYSIVITLAGLLIPYFMLKAMFAAAHEQNPQEKIFHLDDIAKDKDQLNQSMR